MIGIDTSFLVALTVREHVQHSACRALFDDEIAGGDATFGLAGQVLAEYCHVVTDERRFEHPLPMSEALELCELWWNSQEAGHLTVDAEVGVLFLAWMHQFRVGRKRLLDTLLAATWHRAGITRVASTNWRDFSTFGVFEAVPLEP